MLQSVSEYMKWRRLADILQRNLVAATLLDTAFVLVLTVLSVVWATNMS